MPSTLALLSCALCALVACLAQDVALPATVKTCKRDSDDYSSCLRLAIQESWPTFVAGIPELDLPGLDPYFTELQESAYENGQIRSRVTVRNVMTYGLAKSRFLAVRPHFGENYFRLEIDTEFPKILIEGDYKAEGALGSFQIGGKGYFNISIEDVKTTWDLEGPVKDDRWNVEHFRMEPDVGKMTIYFSDLFNGNAELNKAALTFVNQYWPGLYRTMLPIVSESWDVQLSEFANRVFSKISFAKTFP